MNYLILNFGSPFLIHCIKYVQKYVNGLNTVDTIQNKRNNWETSDATNSKNFLQDH